MDGTGGGGFGGVVTGGCGFDGAETMASGTCGGGPGIGGRGGGGGVSGGGGVNLLSVTALSIMVFAVCSVITVLSVSNPSSSIYVRPEPVLTMVLSRSVKISAGQFVFHDGTLACKKLV